MSPIVDLRKTSEFRSGGLRLPHRASQVVLTLALLMTGIGLTGCRQPPAITPPPQISPKPPIVLANLNCLLLEPSGDTYAGATLLRQNDQLVVSAPAWETGQAASLYLDLPVADLQTAEWRLQTGMTLEVTNLTQTAVGLTVVFEDEAGSQRFWASTLQPGANLVQCPFVEKTRGLRLDKVKRFTLRLQRGPGPVELALDRLSLRFEPEALTRALASRLVKLEAQLGTLPAAATESLRAELAALHTRVNSLTADMTVRSGVLPAELEALSALERVDFPRIQTAICQALAAHNAGSEPEGPGYLVVPGLAQVSPEEGFAGDQPQADLRLVAARGEVALAQVVLSPGIKPLREVEWELEPLIGPEGASLPEDSVEVLPLGYVYCKAPAEYATEGEGWYPDALLSGLQELRVPANRFRSLLVRFTGPKAAKPGLYKGQLAFISGGGDHFKVAIQAEVLDYTLPQKATLPAFFPARLEYAQAVYGNKAPQFISALADLLLQYRMMPLDFYAPPVEAEQLELLAKAGQPVFPVGYLGKESDPAKADEQIRAELESLKQLLGQLPEATRKQALFYLMDEAPLEDLQALSTAAGVLKIAFPDLRLATSALPPAAQQHQGLRDLITDWIVLTSDLPLVDEQALRANKARLWGYIANQPTSPYANCFIESSWTGLRSLAGAQALAAELDGLLYYAVNKWCAGASPLEERPLLQFATANDHSGNGVGWLVYPGKAGPLASMRLEALRQGLQDHTTARLLGHLAQKAAKRGGKAAGLASQAQAALATKAGPASSFTDYSLEPEDYEAWHLKISRLTAQLTTALDESPKD